MGTHNHRPREQDMEYSFNDTLSPCAVDHDIHPVLTIEYNQRHQYKPNEIQIRDRGKQDERKSLEHVPKMC